jgi:glycerate 2-kinase
MRDDRATLVAAIGDFAKLVRGELAAAGLRAQAGGLALDGDVVAVADRLAVRARRGKLFVAHGEPTLRVPAEHGHGGRAQQLALELARRLRDSDRSALVAGTDGIDGPPLQHRPTPAGAFVDGTTWSHIISLGIDPDAALARCDAGTALHAAGALFVTGPTGVNHADIVIVG